MKILVVGSGIAGLTAYLLLKKHLLTGDQSDIDISIIDAYSAYSPEATDIRINTASSFEQPAAIPAATGNILGISINGLNILKRLDSNGSILQKLKRRGHVVDLWKMSDARGWLNIEFSMSSKSEHRRSAPNIDKDDDIDFSSLIIARQDLWEVLRDAALEGGATIDQKKVVRIETSGTIGQAAAVSTIVHYADGKNDIADLVIGADGLKSVVRKTMFGGENKTSRVQDDSWVSWLNPFKSKPIAEEVDYITPHYEGLVGVGGFIPSSVLAGAGHQVGKMNITFGPNGFFGHGYNTTDQTDPSKPGPTASWWSTFASSSPAPYRLKDYNISSNSNRSSDSYKVFDKDQALKDLLKRQRWWKSPVIQDILDYVERNGIDQFYPTYTTPQLPTWQKDGKLVLIGDAAHTLQPSSGQGASQAMEDAEALALLLKHYLCTSTNTSKHRTNTDSVDDINANNTSMALHHKQATQTALDKYVELRRPRVMAVYKRSQQMSRMKSDLNLFQEMLMYLFLWLLSFKKHDKFNDQLFGYDLPTEVEKIINRD